MEYQSMTTQGHSLKLLCGAHGGHGGADKNGRSMSCFTHCPLEQGQQKQQQQSSLCVFVVNMSNIIVFFYIFLMLSSISQAEEISRGRLFGMPSRSILSPDEDNRVTQDGFGRDLMQQAVRNPLPYFNEEVTRRVSF